MWGKTFTATTAKAEGSVGSIFMTTVKSFVVQLCRTFKRTHGRLYYVITEQMQPVFIFFSNNRSLGFCSIVLFLLELWWY